MHILKALYSITTKTLPMCAYIVGKETSVRDFVWRRLLPSVKSSSASAATRTRFLPCLCSEHTFMLV